MNEWNDHIHKYITKVHPLDLINSGISYIHKETERNFLCNTDSHVRTGETLEKFLSYLP